VARRKLSAREEQRAVDLYLALRSLTEVAAAMGVGRQTIRRVMQRRGEPVARRGKRQYRPRVTAAAHLYLLYDQRIPLQRLARWAGVSQQGLSAAVAQVRRGER
jgi:hypothetical protein